MSNEIKGLKELENYVDEGSEDGPHIDTICQNGNNIILITFDNGFEYEIKGKGLEVVKLPEFNW
jgi:hypothetical protein